MHVGRRDINGEGCGITDMLDLSTSGPRRGPHGDKLASFKIRKAITEKRNVTFQDGWKASAGR